MYLRAIGSSHPRHPALFWSRCRSCLTSDKGGLERIGIASCIKHCTFSVCERLFAESKEAREKIRSLGACCARSADLSYPEACGECMRGIRQSYLCTCARNLTMFGEVRVPFFRQTCACV